MRLAIVLFLLLFLPCILHSQDSIPPLIQNRYAKVTSYEELSAYVRRLDKNSDLLTVEVIGQSVKGRDLYALKFSSSRFGTDKSKIKVLIFAQQHGNEQSGKEGALLLAQNLLKPGNSYLFNKIDLAVIPQMNPDGSEVNERRNAHGVDLNRNHLILTEPETIALHMFFDKYLFDVTADVHEYSPYSEEWIKYGYRKNFNETVGATTNPNVAKEIRKLSNEEYIPFILRYFSEHQFSSFIYCPGGPPGLAYVRHSTFDINDGRQSFGIQNTFSFIQEGMNGKDDLIDNLKQRAEGQMTGMRGLLEYVYLNKDIIKSLVAAGRKNLTRPVKNEQVSIQSEHTGNGQKLKLPLLSYYSGHDTVVTVNDYRPVVKSISDVGKPIGYLIPKQLTILVDWAKRHSLDLSVYQKKGNERIGQYFINGIDSIDFEGDMTVNPGVTEKEYQGTFSGNDYYFISTAQLKGNMIVLALEPKSELGLVTYKAFSDLLKTGQAFPILRVNRK